MRVGSLFSGIGGIELGLEWAGFETAWFVENDAHAQAVLRKRFPDAVVYGDITQIDFSTVPKVDVLTGGFPCQDISNAGKRAGITGSNARKAYAKRLQTFPTVTKSGCGNYNHYSEFPALGQLNPTWTEWLMGFPIGWTELSASETQSYRKSRKSSEKQ